MPIWIMSALSAVGKFFASAWNFYWNRMTLKAKLVLWAIILVLVVIGYIAYLRHERSVLQQQIQQEQINNQLGEDQRLANEEEKLKANANQIANNTNALATQRNAERQRDSSTRSSSQSSADDAYCPKHCNDSSCVEWRKTHQCS